ncbi:UvrD/REP helicase N-terminal domain-containing protein [Modicisalibacter muralis]|uniref:DNA 3'-5' helicase II n=1 Tax=Modicisalibacter muralis TaxID=119000 RepID=A0A1G9PW27_9GAMM|nr:UvrD-helicase domain-containing protein [Halomonas muralis]SDM02970.1 UvrD/REP helicase N-terminal domain-containing protein [Halomonas muralis]
MGNHLTLAVAGSRKTQGIVDHCATLPRERRALVVTYTQTNQDELRRRLAVYAGDHQGLEVLGWYTFLIHHFAKPFLPFKFPGKRVQGFNFDGRPMRMAKGYSRFLDSNGAVYACELGRLAHELVLESRGTLVHRLECLYEEILIDEAQDLSSHDWEIIDVLLGSSIDIRMVGDIRQSVLATNPRSAKNKRYAYAEVIGWFREREAQGLLEIMQSATTWRCHPDIASFSDTIFDASWLFPVTDSKNDTVTSHDGVFLVYKRDVEEYVVKYKPQCLRHSASSGKEFNLTFLNFKLSKGSTHERVLIVPTRGILQFLQTGAHLEPGPAASFYVAITRAKQSVAIIVDDPGNSSLPYWQP